MSNKQVQFRRGTTAENNVFVGVEGELTVDTEGKNIRLHDGYTAGGTTVGAGGGGSVSLISKVSVASSTGSVEFSAIPDIYTDLILVVRARVDSVSGSQNVQLQYNGDTANNYVWYSENRFAAADHESTTSAVCGQILGANGATNRIDVVEHIIYNYSGTTFYKDGHGSSPVGGTADQRFLTEWANTAAITDILITLGAGSFVPGSIISLYGRE